MLGALLSSASQKLCFPTKPNQTLLHLCQGRLCQSPQFKKEAFSQVSQKAVWNRERRYSHKLNRRKEMAWTAIHQEQPGTREHVQGITLFFPSLLLQGKFGWFPRAHQRLKQEWLCEVTRGTGENQNHSGDTNGATGQQLGTN